MNSKSITIKLLLTIPAILLGVWRLLKMIFYYIGNICLFILRITGIMFILRPVEELWKSQDPIKEDPIKEDDEEEHDFH